MTTEDCILHAYELTGDGSGKPLKGQLAADKVKAKELAWVHLDASHPDTRDWLFSNVDYMDDLIIDALS